MCGIAGILTTKPESGLEKRCDRMKVALHHRGPDDQGVYLSPDRTVALVHTRLSILDLSTAGHQPMGSSDGRYWICFNGEIYNFQEIRSQLIAKGETFHSQTDTEVILKLYRSLGPACVDQLRGMFAFAIWDNHEKTCFMARDPLGIKPLYYWKSDSTLGFASEVRSLLASGLPSRELSAQGLYGYLLHGSVPEPHTLVEGVHCLEAGTWLQWKAGHLTQKKYWQIQFGAESSHAIDAPERLRKALLDSVQHHYVSDVPVGVFLSGGIDSTALVALSRQVNTGTLKTYSIAFEEPEWNEGAIARRVAQEFETEHTEYVLTETDGKSLFPKFLQSVDQPSIDGFNSFCVSQLAHQKGQKVVLSGLGSDELFAGYKSFTATPRLAQWGRRGSWLTPAGALAGQTLERCSYSPKLRRIGDFLQRPYSLTTACRSFRGIFSHWEAVQLTQHFRPDQVQLSRPVDAQMAPQPSIADAVSVLELSRYMRNQLLRDSDTMSMAWGLELRVPFVDRQLLENIASIPSEHRLASGKQLLVQAVPEIPDWVVNRPKQGFRFPFDQWFEADWPELNAGLPIPKDIVLNPWYRRWSLAVLQNWCQEVLAA